MKASLRTLEYLSSFLLRSIWGQVLMVFCGGEGSISGLTNFSYLSFSLLEYYQIFPTFGAFHVIHYPTK